MILPQNNATHLQNQNVAHFRQVYLCFRIVGLVVLLVQILLYKQYLSPSQEKIHKTIGNIKVPISIPINGDCSTITLIK